MPRFFLTVFACQSPEAPMKSTRLFTGFPFGAGVLMYASSLTLTFHILRLLVIAHRHESAVPQMGILCPLHELELPHQHRLSHLHSAILAAVNPAPSCQPSSPADWQTGTPRFPTAYSFEQFDTRRWREAVARSSGIYKVGPFLIADNERIEVLG